MKRDSLSTLFRDTMDALHPSADAGIEALRRRWAKGDAHEAKVAPEILQELTDEPLSWATSAYRDLERSGFFKHNYQHFLWRDAGKPEIGRLLAGLAALETAALLRASAINMAKVQGELDYRHANIVRAAEGGTALPVAMAMQRYFTTLVASIGSAELMGAYAKLNKVSVCYGWANHLQTTDIKDIADWIVLLSEAVAARDARRIARLCPTSRYTPSILRRGTSRARSATSLTCSPGRSPTIPTSGDDGRPHPRRSGHPTRSPVPDVCSSRFKGPR